MAKKKIEILHQRMLINVKYGILKILLTGKKNNQNQMEINNIKK